MLTFRYRHPINDQEIFKASKDFQAMSRPELPDSNVFDIQVGTAIKTCFGIEEESEAGGRGGSTSSHTSEQIQPSD